MKFYVCVTEDRIYSAQASDRLVPDSGEYVFGPYSWDKAASMVIRHGDRAKPLYRKLNYWKLRRFLLKVCHDRAPPGMDRRRVAKTIKEINPDVENGIRRLEESQN